MREMRVAPSVPARQYRKRERVPVDAGQRNAADDPVLPGPGRKARPRYSGFQCPAPTDRIPAREESWNAFKACPTWKPKLSLSTATGPEFRRRVAEPGRTVQTRRHLLDDGQPEPFRRVPAERAGASRHRARC